MSFLDKLRKKKENNHSLKPYIESKEGEARYIFEHLALKDQFFENTFDLVNGILEKDKLYGFSEQVAKSIKTKNPFQKEDIEVEPMKWNSEIFVIKIT